MQSCKVDLGEEKARSKRVCFWEELTLLEKKYDEALVLTIRKKEGASASVPHDGTEQVD